MAGIFHKVNIPHGTSWNVTSWLTASFLAGRVTKTPGPGSDPKSYPVGILNGYEFEQECKML